MTKPTEPASVAAPAPAQTFRTWRRRSITTMTKPTEPASVAAPAPAQTKRTYCRRGITTDPGTKLVMEQEDKLAEARRIARALNDVAIMSYWGIQQIETAISQRRPKAIQELSIHDRLSTEQSSPTKLDGTLIPSPKP